MVILKSLFFMALSLSVFAGPGHGHDHHGHSHQGHSHGPKQVSQEETGPIGREHIQRLVKAKKIDKSWLKSSFEKSVKKGPEWLVTFTNEKGKKGKKKLYIFLKLSGSFVAANFTGK